MPPNDADQRQYPAYEPLHNEYDDPDTLSSITDAATRQDLEGHEDSGLHAVSPSPNTPDENDESKSDTTSHSPTLGEPSNYKDEKPNGPETVSVRRYVSSWFCWELIGIIVSAGLLAAIIIILKVYDHQPQPKWWHISLNSVISFLSTLSRASLMFSVGELIGQLKWVWFAQQEQPLLHLQSFDSASRGALGSLTLIWALRVRHFAGVGALAMVLALGFDPFSQLLIHTYDKLVVDPSGTALIGNATVYDTIGQLAYDKETLLAYVDPVLKANVYNSLFNTDPTRPWAIPQYSCSSTNCTWDAIASLEMRSLCSNITSALIINCSTFSNESVYAGDSNCNATLPKGGLSASYIPGDYSFTTLSMKSILAYDAVVYTNATLFAIQYIAPRASLELLDDKPWANSTQWEATECSLEPIVRSSRPKIFHNNYSDKTQAIWIQHDWTTTHNVHQSAGLNLTPDSWGPDLGVHQNPQSFILSGDARESIYSFLAALFSGQATRSGTEIFFEPVDASRYAASDTLQALAVANISGCSEILSERLSCAMDNVAAAMSKTFRDAAYVTDPASAAMTTGSAKVSEVYIVVYWAYLALPVLVWTLGAILVLGTLWKTRRARVPAWKNDTLPLLFLYGNKDEGMDLPQGSETEQASRHELVRLYNDESRVFLGRCTDSKSQRP
ncbi:DUF3176 domain-containing protein [Aspergillus vadensis CBS 113365]|uniref:Uncharacterized protein n=1 Tax=Aspergillus vadensis (strain CBS 113365 / IMI 142717 / IBT 24658) TaxID=1448311 RepID=A0A319BHZ7_ASPVC|nr:hypothetical protein BO88DRAFT_486243 [Aspergillus vadensis CBS 113365]PYH71774.1 hypothetical protein BO88DRAFT_486243 [Aspergillus vadensis CBS 113365]